MTTARTSAPAYLARLERADAERRARFAAVWVSPAHERLAGALDRLVAAGVRPVCTSVEAAAWTSEDREDRAIAALFCVGCPVLGECAAAGESEIWGVWAGVDRGEVLEAARREKLRMASAEWRRRRRASA